MVEKLYCPRCAGGFAAGTAFCRTCGLELDGVTKIVKGGGDAPVKTARPNVRLMGAGIGLFILSLVSGLIFGALREFELFPDHYGKAVFYAFVAVSMLTIFAGLVFPSRRYSKPKAAADAESGDFGTAPLGSLPDVPARGNVVDVFTEAADRPMSVTERTTRNLE